MKATATIVRLAACVLLSGLAGCTDDFSEFRFEPKQPTKTRDSGASNMSDATDTDDDAGSPAAQTE